MLHWRKIGKRSATSRPEVSRSHGHSAAAKNQSKPLTWLAAGLCIGLPQASLAAVDEITVTGLRQAYQGEFAPLEKPEAVQQLDAKTLQDSGAKSLSEALDLSAAVSRQNNFGGLWNSFAVRGFVGDENLPSNYLVNGFNAGRGFAGPRDMSSVESIDVLKGPKAALFGRGEPGGTINLVTKRPGFDPKGQVVVAAGSFDTYRLDGDWNTPFSDNFAARWVGFYEEADSFRDTVTSERKGFSPSLLWVLADATRLNYELEYSQQEIPMDRGVLAVAGKLGRILESRFLGEPGDGPISAEALGHQLELQHDFNPQWSALLGLNTRRTDLEGFSTEPELAANRQQLYRDGQNLTRQRRFRDYAAEYGVVRGEVVGRLHWGAIEHRLLAGFDADHFEIDQVFLRARAPALSTNPSLTQQQAINIYEPVYGQYPLPTPGPQTNSLETQKSQGLFIQDQISLTEALDVRLGARLDDYSQTLRNRTANTRTQQDHKRTTPQAGVVYALSDKAALYASYGENFRPLSGVDAAGNGFSPNATVASEIGVKWDELADGLAASLSLFKITQDNMLTADPANAGFSIEAGKAQSQGIELDVNGQLAGWNLWFSYAYLDAQMRNNVLDANFGASIRSGDRLLNIPKQAASLQISRETQFAQRALSYGLGYQHVGERLGETATGFTLPAYNLARLFTRYAISDALALRLEVNNLFDETYYTNSFSALWVQPGTPRSARLSAELSF